MTASSFLVPTTPARSVELPRETWDRLQVDRLAAAESVHRARSADRRAQVEAFILHGMVVACLVGLIVGATLLGMRP